MKKNSYDGQLKIEPFKAPAPIAPGSDSERFAKHRARFKKVKFDLDQENKMTGLAAFKLWHCKQQQIKHH